MFLSRLIDSNPICHTIYAFLVLPMKYNKLKTFCDENNVSCDLTVHLGRTVSIINSQTVIIDVNTKIEPITMKLYKEKQCKYQIVGKLPIRSIILGPSGSGKTVWLQHMILNIYKDWFQ